MKSLSSENLIQSLSQGLQPIPWYKKPRFLLPAWLVFSTLYFVVVLVWALGVHADQIFSLDAASLSFVFLILGLFITGTLITLMGSVPGYLRKANLWWIPAVVVLLWLCALFLVHPPSAPSARSGMEYRPEDLFCSEHLALIAALPSLILFLLTRWLAPTRPRLIAAYLLLTSSAGAALCMEFFCGNRSFLHRLYGHWSIVIVFGLVGLLSGKKLFKW